MYFREVIVHAMDSKDDDEQFEKYLQGRVVLPIDHEKSKEYETYLSEVPEFEDPSARERAVKGDLVLTKIAVVGEVTHAGDGLPERRMLIEHVTCWWDPDTDELWDQETFCKLGKRTACWNHGNCVVKKETRAYRAVRRLGGRSNWYALRDSVERALWEQEKSINDHVDEQMNSVVRSAYEDIAALKKRTDSLAEENAGLRHQLEELRQQFNAFSLTLASPFDSFT